MSEHIVKMNDEEWASYIMLGLKDYLKEKRGITELEWECHFKPLRLEIGENNTTVEYVRTIKESEVKPDAAYVEEKFGNDIREYLKGYLGGERDIEFGSRVWVI